MTQDKDDDYNDDHDDYDGHDDNFRDIGYEDHFRDDGYDDSDEREAKEKEELCSKDEELKRWVQSFEIATSEKKLKMKQLLAEIDKENDKIIPLTNPFLSPQEALDEDYVFEEYKEYDRDEMISLINLPPERKAEKMIKAMIKAGRDGKWELHMC